MAIFNFSDPLTKQALDAVSRTYGNGGYPDPYLVGRPDQGFISPYDLVIFESTYRMPLHEPPEGGTKLKLDKQKTHGVDWSKFVTRGYEAKPIRLTLLLFKDTLTGINYLDVYHDHVKDLLMPTKLSKRNAIEIYNPTLAAEGITSLVIEDRGVPKRIADQRWTVLIEGFDLRFATGGNKTAKVNKETPIRHSDVAIGDTPGPTPKQFQLKQTQDFNQNGVKSLTPSLTLKGLT